jgi:hypothetical protein
MRTLRGSILITRTLQLIVATHDVVEDMVKMTSNSVFSCTSVYIIVVCAIAIIKI